jgi:hypothetical protein
MRGLIELHFKKCFDSLAARKAYLLCDLDNEVNQNSMNEHHPLLSKKD